MSQSASDDSSVLVKGRGYFSQSVDELKKVSKPTKQEATQATLVAVALVIFVALVIAVFDLLFGQLMNVIVS